MKRLIRTWSVARVTGVLLLLLASPLPLLAAQVEGRVVDAEGAGVVLAVVLEVHDGQQVVYQQEGLTDSAGLARWIDVPETDGLSARIRASYDGAVYISSIVALDNGAGRLQLTVLPVVREGRPLHLDTLHLIVQADEPGILRVLQFMTVSNPGAAAFAGGPQLADGRAAGIVIPLPAGAMNVRPAPFPSPDAALDLAQAQVDSDRILDARPVPPGGRQVAVTYELSLADAAASVSLLVPYPTQSASLLLGGAGAQELTVTSNQLQARQAEMIGDQRYQLWMAETLQPGGELTFSIGAPGLTLTAAQIGLLAAAAGLLLAVAGSMLGGGSVQYRAEQRRTVLAAVAALDDAHDAGDIGRGDYFSRRGRELDRLAFLDVEKGASKRVSD